MVNEGHSHGPRFSFKTTWNSHRKWRDTLKVRCITYSVSIIWAGNTWLTSKYSEANQGRSLRGRGWGKSHKTGKIRKNGKKKGKLGRKWEACRELAPLRTGRAGYGHAFHPILLYILSIHIAQYLHGPVDPAHCWWVSPSQRTTFASAVAPP